MSEESDELDSILDKIKNRWETDLTRSLWDDTWMTPKEEGNNEEASGRDVPKISNRARKKQQRRRRR